MSERQNTPHHWEPECSVWEGDTLHLENSVLTAVRVTKLNLKASRMRGHTLKMCQGKFRLGEFRLEELLHQKGDHTLEWTALGGAGIIIPEGV